VARTKWRCQRLHRRSVTVTNTLPLLSPHCMHTLHARTHTAVASAMDAHLAAAVRVCAASSSLPAAPSQQRHTATLPWGRYTCAANARANKMHMQHQ
jgi:hypothetical protein